MLAIAPIAPTAPSKKQGADKKTGEMGADGGVAGSCICAANPLNPVVIYLRMAWLIKTKNVSLSVDDIKCFAFDFDCSLSEVQQVIWVGG